MNSVSRFVREVPIVAGAHYVYLHYDDNDELLYVGQTSDPINRLTQHARAHKARSHWWGQVARIEWEMFDSKRMSVRVERLLIRHMQPKHNVQGRNDREVAA
jgi:excinuclease UvrABC nuclease subunit